MGNIQNRKKEYESGLNMLSIAKLAPGLTKYTNESTRDFLDRAVSFMYHARIQADKREDPGFANAKDYIEKRGW